jgi:hypothetical protein
MEPMSGRKITAEDLPKSATSSWITLIGVISFIGSLFFILKYNIDNSTGAIIAALALALPIALLELIVLKTFRRSSTGLNFSQRNPINVKRVLVKLVGLYVTLAVVAFCYFLFPEYNDVYYAPYWDLVKYLLAITVVGALPYYFILDMYLIEPEESYWKVGMTALGQWNKINSTGLKNHFLGWAVKAFFLPLMYIPLSGNIGFIEGSSFLSEVGSSVFFNTKAFTVFFDYTINMIFTVDLLVIFVGYILTMRVFDSHIRSVEPSFLGWYVALQCYKPFWNGISMNYFAYDFDGYFWKEWLHIQHNLYVLWGLAIIILLGIYTWASVIFGLRFSNLTHRGIITNGPFRFMRHPAYFCKNLSWWLISIPFIPQMGVAEAIRSCIMLLLLNLIYFLRAKTEERHLSLDPVYVQYANVINEIGIFRWLMKRVSFLRYDETKVYKIGSLPWMRS